MPLKEGPHHLKGDEGQDAHLHRLATEGDHAEPGCSQAGEVYLVRQVKEAVEGDVGREDVHSSLEISRGGGPFS